jgi:hypothetical protein
MKESNPMRILSVMVIAGALLLGASQEGRAQEWYGMATWQVSFPAGDTKDFVDEVSFRGFGMEFRKTVRPATTIGLLAGWNVFHERTNETVEFENGAISGSQDRYINSFPIMLGAHRYFGAKGGTRPYIGLNGGGFIVIRTARVGIVELEEDTWVWGLTPEAGLIMPMSYGAAFVVNGRYHWSPTWETLAGSDTDLTYWGLHVGFVWEQH